MVINMVIVDNDVDRGALAGRQMANDLRKNFRDWIMFVHVRTEASKTTDDAFARYTA
jgi:hypothetical protein